VRERLAHRSNNKKQNWELKTMTVNNKRWTLAAVGSATIASLALAAGAAGAYKAERIEYEFTTKYFSDTVSGGGALNAAITTTADYSNLNIFTATSGKYNSRLSTRCSDGRLLETAPRKVTGTSAGDVTHDCGGNIYPLRIEGAIDDL
jgi:hypothetical protein